jgi:serine/threonine-protein kinase
MATHDKDRWGFREGDRITGDLTAMRLLGGGTSYEAYLAFDEITYFPVVVKVLRPGRATDGSSLRGLRREISALATVNHPVVVRGLRHEVTSERPHLVLEHVDGPRLSTLVRQIGALQPQQYLSLAIDIASALQYFAHLGWVHLDIKPSNIIMGSPARLIDLSVARPADEARALRVPIGTDFYMSPEQCDPGRFGLPDHPSDVWGLGATLFEAVAGYRPFDAGDADAEDPRERYPQLTARPHALPGAVPAEVAKAIDAALAPSAADRPAPGELVDALEPVLMRLPRPRIGGLKVHR